MPNLPWFCWVMPALCLIISTFPVNERSCNPVALFSIGAAVLLASLFEFLTVRRHLCNALVILSILVIYAAAVDWTISVPVSATRELMVRPAALVLAITAAAVLVRPARAAFASRTIGAMALVGLLLIGLGIALAVILKRHYSLDGLALAFGMGLRVIEWTLLVGLATRISPAWVTKRRLRTLGVTTMAFALPALWWITT